MKPAIFADRGRRALAVLVAACMFGVAGVEAAPPSTMSFQGYLTSAGGAPERVFEGAGDYAIHPDGSTIAFQRAGGIFVGARGQEPRELERVREIRDLRLVYAPPEGIASRELITRLRMTCSS